jgi:flagellin
MSFSINTNVASLSAQNYLRVNSNFQATTINRVTSGLRIVQSGDDAAGLAIANGYRSDQAVLTQGVRNANDGMSQLQIIDGGMNNVSQLLDRARTLATQSATGTFTGDRGVLNSEFQSVLGEIDRQAQSIGLDTSGIFAKSLSVFIGGGKTSGAVNQITNGSVSVDLTQSTVDSKSLGLKGVQAVGASGVDIGPASSTGTAGASQSVAKLVADTTNQGSEVTSGSTDFYFQGAGFSGANKVKVSVNLAGVTDTNTLVTAINTAIQNVGGASQYATAFKNAGVNATVSTDSTGKQHLAFNSSVSGFQVEAGDRMSNALLGNVGAGTTTGTALANTVAGNQNYVATATAAAARTIIVRFQGSGLDAPEDLTLNVASGAASSTVLTALQTAMANDAKLSTSGIKLTGTTTANPLQFTSNKGEQFQVMTTGDADNLLGMGTFSSGAGAVNFDQSTIHSTATAGYASVATTLNISIGGGAAIATNSFTPTAATQAAVLAGLNNEFSLNATFQAAGLVASADGDATHIKITSTNGTNFRVATTVDGAALGFDFVTGKANVTANTTSAITSKATVDAGGTTQTNVGAAGADVFYFGAIKNGSDNQTITLTAPDAAGAEHTLSVGLTNLNARSLDEAIATINSKLQQSNDTTLQNISAVKEQGTTTGATLEGLRFLSTLGSFKVSVGSTATGSTSNLVGIAENTAAGSANYVQGKVYTAAVSGTGSTVDISNQGSAQTAVTALANSVASLGKAQAVVGRGENVFNFAVNLAQSQLTNLATAESRIRDADLAAEAANLTKAQILMQAGVAALAQANSAPQQVLSLLRG